MKKVIYILVAVLFTNSLLSQVQLAEIIFQPMWTNNERFCQIMQEEDNPTGIYFSSSGREIVDFIPANYVGEYSVSVRDQVTPESRDIDGRNDAYFASMETERVFKVSINTNRKSAPLQVKFDCNWECEAKVSSLGSNKFLPEILNTTSHLKIMILRAPTYSAMKEAEQVASILRSYGFVIDIEQGEGDWTKETWEERFGFYAIFPAYRTTPNPYATPQMINFLCRALQYNHSLNGFPMYGYVLGYYEGYDFWFALPTW